MIRQTLKLYAIEILNNPSFDAKIAAGLAIGEYANIIDGDFFDSNLFNELSFKYKDLELRIKKGLPQFIENYETYIPLTPGRDPSWTFDQKKEQKFSLITEEKERIFMLLEATYVDVEINAMEVSSVLFLLGQSLPLDFYKDFGSLISDESNHAKSIKNLLSLFPEFPSAKSYSNRVWNKVSKGETILERVMIENVIEEGSAADKTIRLIHDLEKNNFNEVAQVFKKLNEDEIRHASIGNKWAMRLLNGDEDKYFSMFEYFAKLINPEAMQIESIKTRLSSGFSKSFIKRYF